MQMTKFFFIALILSFFALTGYAQNNQTPSDGELTQRITTELAKAKNVPLSEISTHVYKGDVSLCGFVNQTEKRATLRAVNHVKGVNKVYDDLILRSKIENSNKKNKVTQNVSDAWITTKVKQKLLTGRNIPSTAISVETYKGNVLLCGYLNDKPVINKAVKITSKVKGVRAVINGLKVKSIKS